MIEPEKIQLPKIGDIISVEHGIALCRYYGLDHLADRVAAAPENYKPFKFDGLSMIPDGLFALISGLDEDALVHQCALPHDLKYAYGTPGDEEEKKEADIDLYDDLVTHAHMRAERAMVFFDAVQIGGAEKLGLSFTWAFAHKK